jgi:hypothetical protein
VFGIPCFAVRDTTEHPIAGWGMTDLVVVHFGGPSEAIPNAWRAVAQPIEGSAGNAGRPMDPDLMGPTRQ